MIHIFAVLLHPKDKTFSIGRKETAMENPNDVILLNEVYQSARIGMEAVDMILPKTKDLSLIGDLSEQRAQYLEIAKRAAREMLEYNRFPEDQAMVCKTAIWSSIQFSTLFNPAPKNIAQLMINGSRKGMDELNQLLARRLETQPQTAQIANDYVTLEQNNVTKLSNHLSCNEKERPVGGGSAVSS